MTTDNDSATIELRLLRSDFKEFRDDMRATMRIICDPITGYVPRSEMETRFQALTQSTRFTVTCAISISAILTTLITLFVHH